MRKPLILLTVLLLATLALAAHSQTARIGAGGAARGTAAGVTRIIPPPSAAAPRTVVIPGYGIQEDDGTEKVYLIPGHGIYAGAP